MRDFLAGPEGLGQKTSKFGLDESGWHKMKIKVQLFL
jgi:hypothetical protein